MCPHDCHTHPVRRREAVPENLGPAPSLCTGSLGSGGRKEQALSVGLPSQALPSRIPATRLVASVGAGLKAFRGS